MRTLALIFAFVFAFAAKAQVNFSAQANGLSVTFSITQASNYYEFINWSFGDGTTSNGGISNNPVVHNYAAPGNYSACVIGYPMPLDPNDTACKFVNVISTGIQNNSPGAEFHLFPNPVTDKLTIDLSNSNTVFQLSLSNALGKTVYVSDKINKQQAAIDLGFLGSGIYFLRIENDGEQRVFKIVKD